MSGASFSSILNDVIGPIMRGPSSSHTAASWRMGRYARFVLGEAPRVISIVFEDQGAFADVFASQRADLAFIAGAMPLPSVKTLATELATFSSSMPVLRFLSDFFSAERES